MNGDGRRMNGCAPDSSNRFKSLVMLHMLKNVVAALLALFSLVAIPSSAQARLQCVTYTNLR